MNPSSESFAVQVWRPPLFAFGPAPPPQRRLITAARRLQRLRLEVTAATSGDESSGIGKWWLSPAAVLEIASQLGGNDHAVLDGFLGGGWATRLRQEAGALISSEGTSAGRVGAGDGAAASALRSDTTVWAARSKAEERAKRPMAALDRLVDAADALVGGLRNGSHGSGPSPSAAAAAAAVAEALRKTTWHSDPMLSLYARGGHKYVRHNDNICEGGEGKQCNGRRLTLVYYMSDSLGDADAPLSAPSPPPAPFAAGALRLFHRGPPDSEARVDIEPRVDRLVLFWSDLRVPHAVLPTDEEHDRYAATLWYFDAEELARAKANERAARRSVISCGAGLAP